MPSPRRPKTEVARPFLSTSASLILLFTVVVAVGTRATAIEQKPISDVAATATEGAPRSSSGERIPSSVGRLTSSGNEGDAAITLRTAEKRGWSDLQHGGWGKRGWKDLKAASWGKRGWEDLRSDWSESDREEPWNKRAWNKLRGSWGKRAWDNLRGSWGKRDDDWTRADPLEEEEYASRTSEEDDNDEDSYGDEDEYGPFGEVKKRSRWANLKGAWGKRDDEETEAEKRAWKNFKGSWGKRDGGWRNLKGVWGKRSSSSSADATASKWNKLNSVWGKRAMAGDS